MNRQTQQQLILWTKRLLGVATFLVWGYVIFTISNTTTPFEEQVPYCMGSTMAIFMLLTALYKGLDYWERESKEG